MASSILLACAFAADKHKLQRRKDKDSTPYINHCLGVAKYILEANEQDVATLTAAVLHDTVEDTKTTFEEIERQFGTEVMNIVKEVTDDKSLAKDERKKLQIEHSKHASRKAKLVKLADKLYNLRDLLVNPIPSWSVSRIQGYFVWSYEVVEGMRGTNQRLERQLDEVFASILVIDGISYPALPGENQDELLQAYYEQMSHAKD